MTTEMIRLLEEHKRKPYLPVWGELFALLYRVKRKAEDADAVLEAYTIGGQPVVYDPAIKKFCCQIGEISFRLTLAELTDSLARGAFAPKDVQREATR